MALNFEEGSEPSKRLNEEALYRFHSREGTEFTLEKSAAQLFGVVKQISRELGVQDDESIREMKPIPLMKVSSETLNFIVKWCDYHKTMPPWEEEKWWLNERDGEMKNWENTFMDALTSEQLFNVITAADHLGIKCLVDKSAEIIAGMIKGKTVEEIRECWRFMDDLMGEEQEAMKVENALEVILRDMEALNDDVADQQTPAE